MKHSTYVDIYVCSAQLCGNGDLADRLRSAAQRDGLPFSIEDKNCLRMCLYNQRVNVISGNRTIFYGEKVYARDGRIIVHPLGDDSLKTLVDGYKPKSDGKVAGNVGQNYAKNEKPAKKGRRSSKKISNLKSQNFK